MARESGVSGVRVDGATVTSSAVWVALSTASVIPILTVTTIVLARVLGAAGIGSLALYTFVSALACGVIDLGIGNSILRKGMLAAGTGDPDDVLRQARAGTTWSIIQIPAIVIVGFFLLPRLDSFVVYTVGMLLAYLFIGPSHFLVMTSRLKIASQMRAISTALASAASIGVAVMTHRPDLVFAVGVVGTNLMTVAQGLGVPSRMRGRVLLPGPIRLERADVWFGLGVLLNGQLSSLVFTQSEIALFRPSQLIPRGRYSASQTIAARSTLLLDALLSPITSGLTSAFGRGEEALTRAFQLCSDAIVLLYLLTCPIGFMAVSVLSEPVFGHTFHGIALPALLLTAASLIQSASAPVVALCAARRTIRPLLVTSGASALIDLGLAAVLVPAFGTRGAVAAALAGQASFFVLLVTMMSDADGARRLSLHHGLRSSLVVAYGVVPAIAFLLVPAPWSYVLAAPIALGLTLAGTRISAMRGAASLAAVASHLPRRAARVLSSPRVLRVLGEDVP